MFISLLAHLSAFGEKKPCLPEGREPKKGHPGQGLQLAFVF